MTNTEAHMDVDAILAWVETLEDGSGDALSAQAHWLAARTTAVVLDEAIKEAITSYSLYSVQLRTLVLAYQLAPLGLHV